MFEEWYVLDSFVFLVNMVGLYIFYIQIFDCLVWVVLDVDFEMKI